jgi:subtilisin family serine protease
MKRHRQDGWLVTVVALSLLLPACTTPATGPDGKRRIEAWSYVNTKIAPWWWYTLLQLDVIHKRATGSNSTIAIVDTGVLPGHEDLAKILSGMATCGANPADTSDTNGHGTQLAGIALGKDPGPNFTSKTPVITRGLAPDAGLIPIKIDCGRVTADSLLNGVQAAIDKKPDIILIALGGYPPDVNAGLKKMVRSKEGQTVLFVVASVWDDSASFPDWTRFASNELQLDNVLIVAPTTLVDQTEVPYNYRQAGHVWAPGRDIETADILTIPNPDTADTKHPTLQAPFSMQGTSAAAAIVAGCAALVKQKTGDAGAKLKSTLVSKATNKQTFPPNGRLDCNGAVP